MPHALRFQTAIMPSCAIDEFIRRFRHAETAGFDMATTGDHFCDWTNPSRPWMEGWTALTAVACNTARIRIAHYVNQMPLRNPAMLARQALTLDHISGGRLEVGLGIGLVIDPAYDMIGVPNWTTKERVDRFPNYVEVVDQLLSNAETTVEGPYYSAKGATMYPRPVQSPRPPIVIAALGPKMMRIAAKYADNWNTLSFAEDFPAQLAEVKDRVARMRDYLDEAGRSPDDVRFSYQMFDPASRASGGAITYYRSDNLFLDMAESLIELGVSELGPYYPALEDQYPAFERIGQELIPELKRRHGGPSSH